MWLFLAELLEFSTELEFLCILSLDLEYVKAESWALEIFSYSKMYSISFTYFVGWTGISENIK